jgi:hypothetical protein
MRSTTDQTISLTPDEIQEIILRGYISTYNPRSKDKMQIEMFCARDGLERTQEYLLSALEKADMRKASDIRQEREDELRTVDAKIQSGEHSLSETSKRVQELKDKKKVLLPP